jgi:predicted glutamate--cysteine ligase
MRACRLVRVEAPLYLALSAASPFLNSQPTGYHSTRWGLFPKTPQDVPLFTSHAHHIQWVNEQLERKTMQNVRHLWSSVRPNGDRRPYNLNRLELRICDLIIDPIALLAVTSLIEARLWQAIADPQLDPLVTSDLSPQELVALTDRNEMAVAKSSLDAQLQHWQDGRSILASEWVAQLYDEVHDIAKQRGFACFLSPVKKILREGNTAQQWLRMFDRQRDARSVIVNEIERVEQQEIELDRYLCQSVA